MKADGAASTPKMDGPIISSLCNIRMPAGYTRQQLNVFKSYQTGVRFTDVVLVCADGQQVQAHGAMLKGVSGFMETLLKDHFAPPASKAGPADIAAFVYLPDFGGDCVRTFLELLYFGESEIGTIDLLVQVKNLMEMLGTNIKALDVNNQAEATETSSAALDFTGITKSVQAQVSNQSNDTPNGIVSGQDLVVAANNQDVINPEPEKPTATSSTDERINTTPPLLESSQAHNTKTAPSHAILATEDVDNDSPEVINAEVLDSLDDGNGRTLDDDELSLYEEIPPPKRRFKKSMLRVKLRSRNNTESVEDDDNEKEEVTNAEGHRVADSQDEKPENSSVVVVGQENTRKCKLDATKHTEDTESDSELNTSVKKQNATNNNCISIRKKHASSLLIPLEVSTPKSAPVLRLRRIDDPNNPDFSALDFNVSAISIKQEILEEDSESGSDSDSLRCLVCLKRSFKSKSTLRTHYAEHFRERITKEMLDSDSNKCPKCNYQPFRKESLVQHMALKHRVIVDLLRELGIDTEDLFLRGPRDSCGGKED